MISKEEKEKLLKRLLTAKIPEEHWEKMRKKIKAENEKYERIAKAQTLSYEEWHKPFNL